VCCCWYILIPGPILKFRAVSAFVLVLILVAFSFFAILVLPVHEAGLIPLKGYRTDSDLVDNPGMEIPVLRIIAVGHA